MEKSTLTLIDGIYGKAEYNTINEQGSSNIIYNKETYDIETYDLIDSQEYIEGLPMGITKDDYFRMALLTSIKELEKSMDNIGRELKSINENLGRK